MTPVINRKYPLWKYFEIFNKDTELVVRLLCTVKISRDEEGKISSEQNNFKSLIVTYN